MMPVTNNECFFIPPSEKLLSLMTDYNFIDRINFHHVSMLFLQSHTVYTIIVKLTGYRKSAGVLNNYDSN